jgi:hypothetical protein
MPGGRNNTRRIMKDVNFGLAMQYDKGAATSVDINASNVVVEVHQSEAEGTLWYHVGRLDGNTIKWEKSSKYDDGITPTVALNDQGSVVEVHQTQNRLSSSLWYRVGTVNPSGLSINWGNSSQFDDGNNPSVALNNGGVAVEVHETSNRIDNKLWYHVGRLEGNTLKWGPSRDYDKGKTPSIALNNNGLAVEVHKSQGHDTLWYRVGRVNGDGIDWGTSHQYQDGAQPSVALTDDGFVIEVHKSQAAGTLWRMVGQVEGDQIRWSGEAIQFDDGMMPAVAANGTWAVQTHVSQTRSTLWFSTSLITDRANWMGDCYDTLKSKPLTQLVLSASHDAGMYAGNILGKTQDLSLYGQLSCGQRYFDLRPDKDLNIFHGPVDGPPVQEVLNGVKKFMSEGHRELVILKFSHYKGFTEDIYRRLVKMLQDTLGAWLLQKTWSGRLADAPLQTLIGNGGKVLVVCDGKYPVNIPTQGIHVYRDWDSSDPKQGDLTVYDQYSDTMDYDQMSKDQLEKFKAFNGKCKNDSNVPCDLFLLSWTLTPPTDVCAVSNSANRNLGQAMSSVGRNSQGFIPNILYVDYCQRARATDVAIVENGVLELDRPISQPRAA